MSDAGNQPSTHITDLAGRFRVETSNPDNPVIGDFYYNTVTNALVYYTGNTWIAVLFT